ncbi:MAG: YqaE/Pmp3 family membrane protein [Chloroflexota bacterium]
MSLGRGCLCIILPPLAVLDRGCGTVLIVFALTLAGWVPGAIAALVLNYMASQPKQF